MKRLRGYVLKDQDLAYLLTCTPGIGDRFQVHHGIPEGSEFVRVWFDDQRGAFVTVWEHEDFDEVPEGERIPIDTLLIEMVPATDEVEA